MVPPSLEISTSTLSSDPNWPGLDWFHVNTPKSNSIWKGPPLEKSYWGHRIHSCFPSVKRFTLAAPVVPTFPNPSCVQLLVPIPVGPVPGSPSPAWSQHAFGGNPLEKSSNCDGTKAAHGVVKVKGPDQ